jgi:hypothetical protein
VSHTAAGAPLEFETGASTGAYFVMTLLVECRRVARAAQCGGSSSRSTCSSVLEASRRMPTTQCSSAHAPPSVSIGVGVVVSVTPGVGVTVAPCPSPPPRPQGGSPAPLSQYILPYFLTPAMAVWATDFGYHTLFVWQVERLTPGCCHRCCYHRCNHSPYGVRRDAPAFAALSWAAALASLGCPQGIRVALATCLLCASLVSKV